MTDTGRPFLVMAPLALLVAGYPFLPEGLVRETGYSVIGLLCAVVGLVGLVRHVKGRRRGWQLVLGGFLGWVLGDVVFFLEQRVFEVEAYPAVSDGVYIASYGVLAYGLLVLVRRRGERSDLAAMLDGAILAAGVAVVVGVFLISPIAADSSLSGAGKVTSSLYPVADVLLIGILVRLWTAPGARTAAFRLLAAALSSTLLADLVYNVTTITSESLASVLVSDVCWLGGYVLVAGAVWARSVNELTETAPGREDLADPTKRMFVLTGGLLLPAITLLVDGIPDGDVHWEIVAIGAVLLSMLVLARMHGLLTVVRVQAVQLAGLARSDALTGVPNRRTWDHELSRACHLARTTGEPLCVALLDLDHFKLYNDRYGHQAGDLLLREATAAWTSMLGDGAMLARYGGEEFAVLFSGQRLSAAHAQVVELLAHTPGGATASAGVAQWDPTTDPSSVVGLADQALYAAKRGGRNQALTADPGASLDLPHPSIVLQPIVDLSTNESVAVEALSRFAEGPPLEVFEQARRDGSGPALEASAIVAALRDRPVGMMLSINVGVDVLTSPVVRAALTGDLTGIILEITEHSDIDDNVEVIAAIQEYRGRGAVIAVDDWGKGYSDMARLMVLRPDIVKLDMSLVHGMDSEYNVGAVRAAVAWADSVGAKLCAEGIETEEQRAALRELGVHYGQGFLIGRPAPADDPATSDRAAVTT
ncbi:EAL domain-containing protein [Nocardioides sp.]|uniref:EAL domain-containing protein n=1 Tax=Nocardioides sp. TaxID=35761 RepID=UPI001A2596F5|nr:EAL domain-containing protein [Nocardioides sp.]MBJ7356884.1 EAL domain-containing protein [Nocardioides sp.]